MSEQENNEIGGDKMDNNDNFLNEENENKKENLPEDNKRVPRMIGFICGFLIAVLPYTVIFFYYKMYSGYGVISAFFLALLFSFAGIILWAIIKFAFKKRLLALGFLIGGFATLLLMFVFTGGCGIFGNY